MKRSIILCSTLFFFIIASHLMAQMKTDSMGFETFEMQEGDTTFVMKKYFLVLLQKGANTNQDSVESASIQEGHMNHLNKMADDGYLSIAGPSGEDGDLRGILIMNVPTREKAIDLVSRDPAIIAGRLQYKITSWWGAVGSKLE